MQPKPKAQELLDRIEAYGQSDEVNELARKALLRDLDVLLKADPAGASMLHGIMASLEDDEPKTRKWFENALRLEPDNFAIRANFPRALHNLGYFSEAKDLAKKVHESDPSNLAAFDLLIKETISAARAHEAAELLRRRALLKPKQEYPNTQDIFESVQFYDRCSLRDDDVEALLNLSLQVLHDAGYRVYSGDMRIRADEDSEWLSGMFGVSLPVETVLDLNTKLAEVQATSAIPPEVLERVNFMFIPAAQ